LLPSFEQVKAPPPIPKEKEEHKADPPPSRSLAEIEKEAYEKGFEEGRYAGAQSAELEAQELLSGLSGAVAQVRELHEQVIHEVEPQVIELAIAVARRVLNEELLENPGHIVEIVKEAIRRIERTGAVTIRVNPGLADVMSSLKGRSSEFQAAIMLDIDPTVPIHGPIVIGATEEVVTDIDEQIRVIMEELRSERASR
jgi:flagellar assembly protein FliH